MLTKAESTAMGAEGGAGQASREGSGLPVAPLVSMTVVSAGVEGVAGVALRGVAARLDVALATRGSHEGGGAGTTVPGCASAALMPATLCWVVAIALSGEGCTVFILRMPSQPRTAATRSMKTVTMRKLAQRGSPIAWMPSASVMKMK